MIKKVKQKIDRSRIYRRCWIPALLILILMPGGCSKSPSALEKRYSMQGEVVALVPQSKDAVIKAGKIGDWMGPMIMEYPIRPDSDYAKLKVGEHIQATVVVRGDTNYVTGIQIIASTGEK